MEPINNRPVILFDGICNLCNAAVQTVIRNDPRKKFRLGSLQNASGKALLLKHDLSDLDLSSFVLIENGKAFTQSTAALKVTKSLRGLWPLLYGFIIIPKPIRDWFYNFVARNRYRWFGKKESCMVPDENVRDRFIDQL